MFQRRLAAIGILAGGLVVFAACGGGGGDGGGGPGSGDPVIAKATGNNGNGQSGTVGQALTDSFRVVVTQDGSAKAGVTVSWTSQAQGVSLSPTSTVTDAQAVPHQDDRREPRRDRRPPRLRWVAPTLSLPSPSRRAHRRISAFPAETIRPRWSIPPRSSRSRSRSRISSPMSLPDRRSPGPWPAGAAVSPHPP
jgi:hypothetical protein